MIEYTNGYLCDGLNKETYLFFVPLQDTYLDKFYETKYFKTLDYKLKRINVKSVVRNFVENNNDLYTVSTRGQSRAGTGKLNYLMLMKALRYNTSTNQFYVDDIINRRLAYRNQHYPIYVSFRLDGCISKDNWEDVVLRHMLYHNTSLDSRYIIITETDNSIMGIMEEIAIPDWTTQLPQFGDLHINGSYGGHIEPVIDSITSQTINISSITSTSTSANLVQNIPIGEVVVSANSGEMYIRTEEGLRRME